MRRKLFLGCMILAVSVILVYWMIDEVVPEQTTFLREALRLAVIFGANMSFATPIGYQTNLLIMSAGGYRFSDFMRVGVPLTFIMWITFSLTLPFLYDL